MTDAPAWIRNGRHDILAMNQLARARDRALPAIRSDRLHALAHRRALRRRPELTP